MCVHARVHIHKGTTQGSTDGLIHSPPCLIFSIYIQGIENKIETLRSFLQPKSLCSQCFPPKFVWWSPKMDKVNSALSRTTSTIWPQQPTNSDSPHPNQIPDNRALPFPLDGVTFTAECQVQTGTRIGRCLWGKRNTTNLLDIFLFTHSPYSSQLAGQAPLIYGQVKREREQQWCELQSNSCAWCKHHFSFEEEGYGHGPPIMTHGFFIEYILQTKMGNLENINGDSGVQTPVSPCV